jgi:hypothetical protein
MKQETADQGERQLRQEEYHSSEGFYDEIFLGNQDLLPIL